MDLPPCYQALTEPFKSLLELRQSNLAAANFYRNYLSNWGFNQNWYLESNPDLVVAIPSQAFPDGFSHFRTVGYFEGRLPFNPKVDESWYLAQYPDVAAAIIKGFFQNGSDHFWQRGYREGRLPAQPRIDCGWYAQTYLDADPDDQANPELCLDHFISIGYLNGALPRSHGQASDI